VLIKKGSNLDTRQTLLNVAQDLGVQTSYHDIWGKEHIVPEETLEAILKAIRPHTYCGEKPHISSKILCGRDGTNLYVKVFVKDSNPKYPIHWEIRAESGEILVGKALPWELRPCNINEKNGLWFWLPITPRLEEGYHRIFLSYGNFNYESILILSPNTCYLPLGRDEKEKIFGLMLQLYSLRSEKDLGIGDLEGLLELAFRARDYNIRCIGLNPLHALFPHLPEAKSPYSPCTRLFFNPIYLAIQSLPEFVTCNNALKILEESQNLISELKDSTHVQYKRIWELKLRLFRELYEEFKKRKDSKRIDSFNGYKANKGELLDFFATFQSLNCYFKERFNLNSWHCWPLAFQDPDSTELDQWMKEHQEEIEFYRYLTWVVEEALVDTKQALNSKDMFLYLDLPVGVDSSGFETWYFKELFAKDINIGAPPDLFNPKGQDWGLPPIIPNALYKQSFEYFIKTIRSNMEKADILRLDHIMGLMRLFWIPKGMKPYQGAYVTYPMEELLGILALESQRNKCIVVGEDLGTVPDEVRNIMAQNNILSYSVFIFEKTEHRYKLPHEYKRNSLSTITTHDLPTLRGFWEEEDIKKRKQLGLFDNQDLENLYVETRKKDKEMILELLELLKLIPNNYDKSELIYNFSYDFAFCVHKALIDSNSLIIVFQLEDMIGETDQKNLPGTVFEYPNWSLKLSLDINKIFSHPLFIRILEKTKEMEFKG